jgi:hypothetical protein
VAKLPAVSGRALPVADRQWVVRPDSVIRFFDSAILALWPGVRIIRCGGHFEGSTVLHCTAWVN